MKVRIILLWATSVALILTSVILISLKMLSDGRRQTKAGTQIEEGVSVAALATITWDDSVQMDESGRWPSATAFHDIGNSKLYTYDLIPNGSSYVKDSTKGEWTYFPSMKRPHSCVMVGMSSLAYTNAPFNLNIADGSAHLNIAGSELNVNFSYGVVAYTYDTKQFCVYANGSKIHQVSCEVQSDSVFQLSPNVLALFIYNELVLSETQILSLSMHLKTKYFAPKLKYPTSVNLSVSTPMDAIKNAIKSASLSYSVSPSLPNGLSLNEQTGSITGTPAELSPTQAYLITASNQWMNASASISMSVNDSPALDVSAPNINFARTTISTSFQSTVTISGPDNSGGSATIYSIEPKNITELTGLVFDSSTGTLSGTVKNSYNGSISITATNGTGQSSSSTMIRAGTSLTYSNGSDVKPAIVGTVGSPIQVRYASIVNDSGTFVSGTYSVNGDLFGLQFDKQSGSISGVPNKSGSDILMVRAIFSDSSVSSVTLPIHIDPSSGSQSNQIIYAVGGTILGIGCLIALYAYYKSHHAHTTHAHVHT